MIIYDNIPYGQYIYLIWLHFRKNHPETTGSRSVQACMAGLEQPDSAVLLLPMVAGRKSQGCCTDRGKNMAGEAQLLYYKYIGLHLIFLYGLYHDI